jgi:hypothetical protein
MVACPAVPRATARATIALGLVGLWMALLFAGLAAGGAVHLLLLAAVAVFPWRALKPPRS